MNRWMALLIAVVGGAVGAYFAALFLGGALIGVMWLYVFGDDPWPSGWETALGIVVLVAGFGLWARFARLIWRRLRSAS